MRKLKAVLIIGDGMADRPLKELGGKTPLQKAKTPCLDYLAASGITGQMDTIAPGVRPGSDTSHLALLGYDPYQVYTGRGPIEAAGIGFDLKPTDIAFRADFATVTPNLIVKDRRAGRIREGTSELAKAVIMKISGVDIIVKESTAHRAVLILRGKGLSTNITDADKHVTGIKPVSEPLGKSRAAKKTAVILNKFLLESHKILEKHPVNLERVRAGKPPANFLLPRGAGRPPRIKTLEELYGIKGACIAAVGLIKGVGAITGMEVIQPKGATGGLDSNLEAKAEACIQALKGSDFVLMNAKGTDVASHDANIEAKIDMIERIDDMVRTISEGTDAYLAVTADHTTPISVRDHTADPVPVLIHGEEVRRDKVKEYNEFSVMEGGLNRIRGRDLMPILLSYTTMQEMFGA